MCQWDNKSTKYNNKTRFSFRTKAEGTFPKLALNCDIWNFETKIAYINSQHICLSIFRYALSICHLLIFYCLDGNGGHFGNYKRYMPYLYMCCNISTKFPTIWNTYRFLHSFRSHVNGSFLENASPNCKCAYDG